MQPNYINTYTRMKKITLMKQKIEWAMYIVLLLVLANISLTACDDDEFIKDTITVEIAPDAVEYKNDTGLTFPGMMMKEEGDDVWYPHSQTGIKGFTFEEGYYYKLRVETKTYKRMDENTPIGISLTSYKLKKVLEKRAVETTAVN